MAKNDRKKKKPSPKKERTQAAQEQRRRLNEWMALIRCVGVSGGLGFLFDTLTDEERDFFETTRFPPLHLRRAPGHTVPPDVMRLADQLFQIMIQKDLVVVPPGNAAVPIGDYARAVQVLRAFQSHCQNHPSPRADRWVVALDPLVKFDEDGGEHVSPMMTLLMRMNTIGAFVGDLDKMIYSVQFKYEVLSEKSVLMFQWFELSTIEAEHRHFVIGRDRRRAFRVFVQSPYGTAPYRAVLSTRLIPALANEPARDLPVYAQEHVRLRMRERLAPLSEELADYFIGSTLLTPETTPARGNGFLLSVHNYGCRLGYIVAEVVEDPGLDEGRAVLMRTFLFATQSGTPGGDRLSARLNVDKFDKSYFGLDRLDMFLTSDLCQDPVLQRILEECDLGDLVGALGENQGLRATVQAKGPYAQKVRRWLNIDEKAARAERAARAETKIQLEHPGQEAAGEPLCNETPRASRLLVRRLRVLRRGHRCPVTVCVRRPAPASPPAPAPSSNLLLPSAPDPFPGSCRRPRVPLVGHRIRAMSQVQVRAYRRMGFRRSWRGSIRARRGRGGPAIPALLEPR